MNIIKIAIIIVCVSLGCAAVASTGGADRWRDADPASKAFAVKLARKAFDSYVLRRDVIAPPDKMPALLNGRSAVFVSAMRRERSGLAPRCCMGSLYPMEANTSSEIIASAVAAAGRDHRFAPIKPNELKGLTLIVSILDTPRSIDATQAARLDPVTDGLIAQYGDRSGVVLSGETRSVQRMIAWARARAGAAPNDAVRYFEVHDTRMAEEPNLTRSEP